MKKLVLIAIAIGVFGCKSPEARMPVSHSSGSFIDASVERNIKLNEAEHKLIENIIDNYPNADYQASQNGFWYVYVDKIEGDSLTPQFGDIVNFNYNVKDLSGNVIYSENEISTQNYAMDQQELFTGLREGLKLMKAGETVTFLFPSQTAYGYYGDEDRIGTNIPLMCTVKVNSINQKESN
ncbi:MAG: gliding motility-associated peptidyl-prolyl isomerase GldI [Bacteroidia bacterium]|nr:gliding motility-associated peptidyl-prolyl isomerase GldI [Bacteroidia bacterium]NND26377.1 gliding motility-associated peptidyl-prolyl isomerase GldI [Flavobacteriaceae bacterium]MBT8278391.1 gliding motility-associated peptidyl-prolyl isomerase GldI [Bacteroidia bacterium]NNK59154.1 gliding motility-associated peptidyl-prolyl isomerase GldI [Flavobacteriaceae bacterium]NNL33220.1 gliding motility-associated peptidyl-prolyl isomerase GldI [Flavobacteriaceae bacterium]